MSDGSTAACGPIAPPVLASSSVGSRTVTISSVKTTSLPQSGLLPSTVSVLSSTLVTRKLQSLTLVVFHEDGSTDLPIFLRNILDVIRKNQRLVSGAEDPIAIDRHLDDLAFGSAFQFRVYEGGQNFIVSVNIAQWKFDHGENMPGFLVGHLIGEFDIFAIVDGFTHAEFEPLRRGTQRKS